MSEGLTGALVVLVPLLVGALAYLGTRGSTRVNRQAALDQATDRLINQLQEERDALIAKVDRLEATLASIDERRQRREAT